MKKTYRIFALVAPIRPNSELAINSEGIRDSAMSLMPFENWYSTPKTGMPSFNHEEEAAAFLKEQIEKEGALADFGFTILPVWK